ncbi:UBA domain-containing protein [Haematococcus lacustris]|uniref:UBA domain-containing protein n=1 Tax=Haematococcus lacustris TaxID=44745 RepID=A0A699Z338_HAELA|nr:UBA domain-containing protein [Haematococcus lacustris]
MEAMAKHRKSSVSLPATHAGTHRSISKEQGAVNLTESEIASEYTEAHVSCIHRSPPSLAPPRTHSAGAETARTKVRTMAKALRCGQCKALLANVKEAQNHNEITGHTSFEETTEEIRVMKCKTCGKPARSPVEQSMHTRFTGHTEYEDAVRGL